MCCRTMALQSALLLPVASSCCSETCPLSTRWCVSSTLLITLTLAYLCILLPDILVVVKMENNLHNMSCLPVLMQHAFITVSLLCGKDTFPLSAPCQRSRHVALTLWLVQAFIGVSLTEVVASSITVVLGSKQLLSP